MSRIFNFISISTANCTTGRSFRRWLESLDKLPDLIAIQEHKLMCQTDIDEASAYLNKKGFSSVWGQATKGPTSCPVGGVAIAAASRLGCKPCIIDAPHSRAVAAKTQIDGEAEIIFVSSYLHSGRGLKQQNLELLGAVAAAQHLHQRHLIAAGDWQNQPAAVTKTDYLTRGQLCIAAPARPTCIMRKSSSTIDYFIVSK